MSLSEPRKREFRQRSIARRSICATVLLLSLCIVAIYLTPRRDNGMKHREKAVMQVPSVRSHVVNVPSKYPLWIREALAYVPSTVLRQWEDAEYLVVFGVPSVDINVRRRRRHLQRMTCWAYGGVARRANDFVGSMLPLYILARHPDNNYVFTSAALEEAEKWNDVITLPMNEGRVSTKKQVGQDGKWGVEAEVGMSRKTFMWFDLSLIVFSRAAYIAKGDDDMFLRVPQYLVDLRDLPRRGVYWGTIDRYTVGRTRFNYAFGWCYTLARDVAKQFVSYGPLREVVNSSSSVLSMFTIKRFYLLAEDAMVGLTLQRAGYASKILYIREKKCSFHNVHAGPTVVAVTDSSVMVHHVREDEYEKLKQRFANERDVAPRFIYSIYEGMKGFSCR
ncbi:UDP-Gal or UDP-GlcNAc-dependent glycosyltransferase [Trypanosoma brucei equiperdum]|uniref:Hexosyltransferase n=3 Tax=Trypanosoma brucei TaxID=5691 RepID=A0A3L6L4S3_9TRYP|nr:UDP-Gal or UDP-GlcNAc-dependent glycosyltransferase [Trypanosoma brucei equiperdum]